MSDLQPWFERQFSFLFPIEIHPCLGSRLRGTPARLEELTRDLDEAVLTSRIDGKWSIQENAGHLLDLEPLWRDRLGDFLSGAETLTAADLLNRKTHEAGHHTARLSNILVAFRRARLELVDQLAALAQSDLARTALHPRLREPMRLVDHLFFIAEHDDHHLARIWELTRIGSACARWSASGEDR
jgi:uncharacterized damage-inducible protein DinB